VGGGGADEIFNVGDAGSAGGGGGLEIDGDRAGEGGVIEGVVAAAGQLDDRVEADGAAHEVKVVAVATGEAVGAIFAGKGISAVEAGDGVVESAAKEYDVVSISVSQCIVGAVCGMLDASDA